MRRELGVRLNISISSQRLVNCSGNNLMGQTETKTPATLDELLEVLSSENGHISYVWRGQANYKWTPYPTLIRRLRLFGLADSQINEDALRSAEQRVVNDARSRQLLGDGEDELQFMCKLQHHGGSTRLLDVTHDPLIAAYFASSPQGGDCGVIFRYRINPDNVVDCGERKEGWNDILVSRDAGHPILIEPQQWDRRIAVQKGAFVALRIKGDLSQPNFYTNQTADSEVEIIWIASGLKGQLRKYLEDRGLNDRRLFPSIEEFAKENGVSSPLR